jgi:hypothetical protein
MIAGVPSVIASLWNVDDEVTASLMETFYTYLKKGVGRGEALRSAKLDMIKTGRSDPFYWGAFVLCGDDGKISIAELPGESSGTSALILLLVGFSGAFVVCVAVISMRHQLGRRPFHL